MCFLTLSRTGRIMTSGHSWGHYMCPTVFSMIKGKNVFSSFRYAQIESWFSGFKRLCRNAGTRHSAVWTTPVETRPWRRWTRGEWRDTSQPTSWRMKTKRETLELEIVAPLVTWPVLRGVIFFFLLMSANHSNNFIHEYHVWLQNEITEKMCVSCCLCVWIWSNE